MISSSCIYFSIFSTFVYYQQLHAKTFNGANRLFGFLLTVFAFLGMLLGLIYLCYIGYHIHWYSPFIYLIVSLIFKIIIVYPLEMLINKFGEYNMLGILFFSISGFIIWPICAYLMFTSI